MPTQTKINIYQDFEILAGADSTANTSFAEVIGNKEDVANATASEASVIGLLRYILANQNTDIDVAALLGALDTAAASGAVGTNKTIMAYIKQLVTDERTMSSTVGTPAGASIAADLAAIKAVDDAIKVMTDKIGTVANSGGTATIGAILGDLSNVTIATWLQKLGTITNTAGTATLGAILGDFANTTLISKLNVPSADAVTNVNVAQVVGSKDDTVSGTSVIALLKQAIAALAIVPKVNATYPIGSTFWVKKAVTSSSILASGTTDLTGVSSGGELILKQINFNTDSTGLAGGTAIRIKTNNVYGSEIIFTTNVSQLGANATALTTETGQVIETGKKLMIDCTGIDCTGDGVVNIHMQFERVASASTIAAA